MAAPELKPCPFCGSPPKMATGNSTYGRLWWTVWCDACEIELRDREVWDKARPGMLDPAYPAGECVDRWNTRTDTIQSDPRVKALVEAAEWAWPILERYVRHPNDADDLAAFLAALKGAT